MCEGIGRNKRATNNKMDRKGRCYSQLRLIRTSVGTSPFPPFPFRVITCLGSLCIRRLFRAQECRDFGGHQTRAIPKRCRKKVWKAGKNAHFPISSHLSRPHGKGFCHGLREHSPQAAGRLIWESLRPPLVRQTSAFVESISEMVATTLCVCVTPCTVTWR